MRNKFSLARAFPFRCGGVLSYIATTPVATRLLHSYCMIGSDKPHQFKHDHTAYARPKRITQASEWLHR